MAEREFTDSEGMLWRVRLVSRSDHQMGAVRAGLENGWLAFEAGARRRRFGPVPEAWQDATDAQLEHWCRSGYPSERDTTGSWLDMRIGNEE